MTHEPPLACAPRYSLAPVLVSSAELGALIMCDHFGHIALRVDSVRCSKRSRPLDNILLGPSVTIAQYLLDLLHLFYKYSTFQWSWSYRFTNIVIIAGVGRPVGTRRAGLAEFSCSVRILLCARYMLGSKAGIGPLSTRVTISTLSVLIITNTAARCLSPETLGQLFCFLSERDSARLGSTCIGLLLTPFERDQLEAVGLARDQAERHYADIRCQEIEDRQLEEFIHDYFVCGNRSPSYTVWNRYD